MPQEALGGKTSGVQALRHQLDKVQWERVEAGRQAGVTAFRVMEMVTVTKDARPHGFMGCAPGIE